MFQLWSHAALYEDDSEDNFKSTRYGEESIFSSSAVGKSSGVQTTSFQEKRSLNPPNALEANDLERQPIEPPKQESAAEDVEEPALSLWMAILTLLIVTVVCIFFSNACQHTYCSSACGRDGRVLSGES